MWKLYQVNLLPINKEDLTDEDKPIYKHVYDTGVGLVSEFSLDKELNVNTYCEHIPMQLIFTKRNKDNQVLRQYTSAIKTLSHIRFLDSKIVDEYMRLNTPDKVYVNDSNDFEDDRLLTLDRIFFIKPMYNYDEMYKAFVYNMPEYVDDGIKLSRFIHFLRNEIND